MSGCVERSNLINYREMLKKIVLRHFDVYEDYDMSK